MRQGIDGVAQKSIDFWKPLQAESQKASQNKYKETSIISLKEDLI